MLHLHDFLPFSEYDPSPPLYWGSAATPFLSPVCFSTLPIFHTFLQKWPFSLLMGQFPTLLRKIATWGKYGLTRSNHDCAPSFLTIYSRIRPRNASNAGNANFDTTDLFVTCVSCVTVIVFRSMVDDLHHAVRLLGEAIEGHMILLQLTLIVVHHLLQTFGNE